jgi:thioredoxin-related protein
MVKKGILGIFTLLVISGIYAQDMKTFRLYRPGENAAIEIDKAVAKARSKNQHVLIQIGGNWCVWCARFNEFITLDAQIDSVVKANYQLYHFNYPDTVNTALLAQYGFPQRFGFPVFLILDGNGTRLHTQNSAYLEKGKGYDKEKVLEFLNHWSPSALKPDQYKKY